MNDKYIQLWFHHFQSLDIQQVSKQTFEVITKLLSNNIFIEFNYSYKQDKYLKIHILSTNYNDEFILEFLISISIEITPNFN